MEHLKMQTPDIVSENMAYIAQRWPECLTEAKDENGRLRQVVDFDKLRQVLSSDATGEGQERYQFTWPDKRHAIRLANAPTTDTLRPCREDSVDFDNTQNLYIEGDNLEVLKLLRESYLGKVKMIYIDPPYNTGGDFVYKDNFIKKNSDYAEVSGAFDEAGNQVVEEFEKNVDNNGRFHTDWLNMIYPRLKVARDLLTEDGVIFVSIDEHEVENIKKILIEIFGNLNYIGTLIIQTATDNNPGQIKMEHEYILCACKNKNNLKNWEVKNESAKYIQEEYNRLKQLYNSDTEAIQVELRKFIKKNLTLLKGIAHYDNVDKQGVFHDGDIANTRFGGYEYDIIHPVTGKVCKMPEKGYRFPEETMKEMLANDNILFGADETTLPKPKIRIEDAKDRLRSVIYEDGRSSTKRFEKLMARDIFQNPKSDTIIARLIDFICDDGDLVLDFFSGSGTTAEAIFNLGAKQKYFRFIQVQLPENLDIQIKIATNKAKKTIKNAIDFLDSIHKKHLISEIGKERIRRAGKKIKEEHPDWDGDTGFRVLKLDSSNMENVFYTPAETTEQTLFADNIKPDRTDEDLLFQVMMELGIALSDKIEKTTLAGKTVWNVGEGYLMACFEPNVTEDTITDIAKQQPQYFVMADRSLASDNVADNFEQIFNEYSESTVRRII